MKEHCDVLTREKKDRRLLSHVPDASGVRSHRDRRRGNGGGRGPEDFGAYIREDAAGRRYLVDYEVTVRVEKDRIKARALDISTTGMLLHAELGCDESLLTEGTTLSLSFEITPGTLPEGYEMKIKDLGATVVRSFHKENAEGLFIGVQFADTLAEFANKKRGRYMLGLASFFLFVVVFVIIMMRAESVLYFRFNKTLYLYSIIAATLLLSRYLFGPLYRPMKVDPDFTPGVTIIIPCFNEETWIDRTILCAIN